MCRFEIQDEQVCKDVVKEGCTWVEQLKNNVVGLLGYQIKQISSSEREACQVHTKTKIKTSLDALPETFAQKNTLAVYSNVTIELWNTNKTIL